MSYSVTAVKGSVALNATAADGSPIKLYTHSLAQNAFRVWSTTLIVKNPRDLPPASRFVEMIELAASINNRWDTAMPPDVTPREIKIYQREGKTKARYITSLSSKIGRQGPLSIVQHDDLVTVVTREKPVRVCDECRARYVNTHHCNLRCIKYLDSIVDKSNFLYKHIKFFPVTSPKSAKTLWIVYDMETYTHHTKVGKQLKPFLLAYTVLSNDASLEKKVLDIVSTLPHYKSHRVGERLVFYEFNTDSAELCRRFNKLRRYVSELLLDQYLTKFKLDHPALGAAFEWSDVVKNRKLLDGGAQPQYYEMVIMGHNISAFDEILSWSHMLDWIKTRNKYPQFKWKRLFLPRAGKILFNDTFATMPNPAFVEPDRSTYEKWSTGEVDDKTDLKNQGVFFRVRDTYLITHTSLRNAAHAYGLSVQKGCCPYAAVNEYLMTGKYKCDNAMYPDPKYWANEREYLENKPKAGERYDIIEETIKYCVRDVVVNVHLAITLESAYQSFFNQSIGVGRFDVFKRPTVSSNTHALFKQVAYKNQSSHQSHVFSDIIAPSAEGYEHVRKSIRGGRCYPTYLGVFSRPIYVYDICGMYASALTHPMPAGKLCNRLQSAFFMTKIQSKLDSATPISYFDADLKPAIVYADCYPPTLENLDALPPMGTKKLGQLIWTNEAIVGEVVTTIDLITMHNRGWKCTILFDKTYMVWPRWKCICADYVKINIEAKEKASKEGNETLRSLSKLLSNALYGSFATRLDVKKILLGVDLEDETTPGKNADTVFDCNSVTTVLIPDHLSSTEIDLSETLFSNPPENNSSGENREIIPEESSGRNIVKVVDHDDEMLTVYTVERGSLVDNDRYASHIASYVLAWTRAFISEWADFIYREDRGTPIEKREIASVYGDTDSLFLTDLGRERLIRNGSHRIKTDRTRLTFDPENPDLTWAVECETKCPTCKEDAYSEESIFLAPKLYALKQLRCKNGHLSKGKVRAKGHNKSDIDFDVLKKCFMWTHMKTNPPEKENYNTERTTIKKTLLRGNLSNVPMTIKESTLTRVLQPWKNKRLRDIRQSEEIYANPYGVGQILAPYDHANPYQPGKIHPNQTKEEWPEPSTSFPPP